MLNGLDALRQYDARLVSYALTSDAVGSLDLTDDTQLYYPAPVTLVVDGYLSITIDGSTPSETNGLLLKDETLRIYESVSSLKWIMYTGDAARISILGAARADYDGFALITHEAITDIMGRHTLTGSNAAVTSDGTYSYIHATDTDGTVTVTLKARDFARLDSEDWGVGAYVMYVTSDSNASQILNVYDDGDNYVTFGCDSSTILLNVCVTGVLENITSAYAFNYASDTWAHIELNIDGTDYSIYADGVLQLEGTLTQAPVLSAAPSVQIMDFGSTACGMRELGYRIGNVIHTTTFTPAPYPNSN